MVVQIQRERAECMETIGALADSLMQQASNDYGNLVLLFEGNIQQQQPKILLSPPKLVRTRPRSLLGSCNMTGSKPKRYTSNTFLANKTPSPPKPPSSKTSTTSKPPTSPAPKWPKPAPGCATEKQPPPPIHQTPFFVYLSIQSPTKTPTLMQQANLFTLHNSTLKVTYSAGSLTGKPQFSYKKGATTLNFSGSQIRLKQTEIGTLVSVTLKTVPDLRTVVFSLLLPLVHVPDNDPTVQVNIKAIETTNKTSIAGPKLVNGQVQTYKVYTLKGTAQSVVFRGMRHEG